MRRLLIWLLLDEQEREAVRRVRSWFRGSHYVDLMVRRNAQWERWEADALRVLGGLAR